VEIQDRYTQSLLSTLSGHIPPFWSGILKASLAFEAGIKIEVRNDCSTRF